MPRAVAALAVLGCGAGAAALVPPQPAALRDAAQWAGRPLVLPFAWQGLRAAERRGEPAEVFARAQQLLRWLPAWTDGHLVAAYRFALAAPTAPAAAADRGAAAHTRLLVALGWLEQVRADAGRREVELLQAMAMLPEVAAAQEPALAERLRPHGGASALADRHLAAAEALGGSAAVREQRTFHAPALAAGLLDAGDRPAALAVLDQAIARSREVRDQAAAGPWREHLQAVADHLRGRPADLAAARADRRLALLLPHLR